jgi:hypothetical protein
MQIALSNIPEKFAASIGDICFFLQRPYGCDWIQQRANFIVRGLKGRCRVWFKSWAIPREQDLSTFNT